MKNKFFLIFSFTLILLFVACITNKKVSNDYYEIVNVRWDGSSHYITNNYKINSDNSLEFTICGIKHIINNGYYEITKIK